MCLTIYMLAMRSWRGGMAFLAICAGCLTQDTVGPRSGHNVSDPDRRQTLPNPTDVGMKGGHYPTLTGAQVQKTFTAGSDTWWENINPTGEQVCSSSTAYWSKHETCSVLALQKYSTSRAARTYLAIDFDTSSIPDDAVIVGAPVIRLYLTDAVRDSNQTSPPDSLGCPPPPGLYPEQICQGIEPICHNVGVYFGDVGSIGAGMNSVDSVVTECGTIYRPSTNRPIQPCTPMPCYVTILTQDSTFVSKTGVSRYGIDLESSRPNVVSLYVFESADNSDKPLLDVEWTRFDFYGAALGSERWAGFDTLLVPDLVSAASYERLDETLPVYLVWQNSGATGLRKLAPAIRINQASWWNTPGFGAADFTVSVLYTPPIDQEYHACPQGQGLDEVTLNDDGTLTVRDLNFGGIGSRVRIELRAVHPSPDTALVRVVALQWNNPGTYYDGELGRNVDAAPDGSHPGVVVMEESIDLVSTVSFPVRLPTRIVEWVCTDISGALPIRIVEETDLAALSAEMGHPVRWGFGSETRNYQVNVTLFGSSALYIDASDLAMMAADINSDSCTGPSKTGEGDKEKILAWFGIAATGEMVAVGPAGELLPGYEIVDWEQNRRAIADPYGWRTQEP